MFYFYDLGLRNKNTMVIKLIKENMNEDNYTARMW